MMEQHGLPIARTCRAARLSRAGYYKSGIDRTVKDAGVIAALQAIVVEEERWHRTGTHAIATHRAKAHANTTHHGSPMSYPPIMPGPLAKPGP